MTDQTPLPDDMRPWQPDYLAAKAVWRHIDRPLGRLDLMEMIRIARHQFNMDDESIKRLEHVEMTVSVVDDAIEHMMRRRP